MTDLRTRLADAHAIHSIVSRGPGRIGCKCGVSFYGDNQLAQHDFHISDVLLSLPGIAIVELPTAEAVSPFSWLEGSVTATNGLGRVRCYLDDPRLPASEAREIAAALLAAANAAEQYS